MRCRWLWLSLILSSTAAWAQGDASGGEGASEPHDYATMLAATTDYAFRGVSGFYAGIWASTIDFTLDGTPSAKGPSGPARQ